MADQLNFSTAIEACIRNGDNLLEDARLLGDSTRPSTAVALAILAQEEFAKAFILTLASEGIVPWVPEVHRALNDHGSKHLVCVVMEWLGPPLEEALKRAEGAHSAAPLDAVPRDVAWAINILRHEKLERFRRGFAFRGPEWDGVARNIAEGLRDREKQRGVYVNVAKTGWVGSIPSQVDPTAALRELERAERLRDFAGDACGDRVLSFREYRFVKDVVKAVFADLAEKRADV